ncbi:MAG TPA: BTAD domain-containing putative transcriptional regulator [Thermoanaerobaculia bacterium]|nr:BTAD domain-containing putative transcriptional regulator [Thermoanaerobaculia bacterium]
MTQLRLQLLGDYQIHDQTGALVTLSAKKSQALLAYLAVKPSQHVSRDKMANLLWSSTGPEQARQSLRQLLSTLRKELSTISPDQKLLIEESDFLGVDGTIIVADVAELEVLLATGTEEALAAAITLYRGDFLDGFTITEERFDQWVLGERDRLRRAALRAHTYLIELQSKRDAVDDAISTAQSALRIDPIQESMCRTLMRLYMQSGDLAAALQQYDSCARTLKRELGVEPDAETRTLQQQIAQLRAKRAPSQQAETGAPETRKTVLVVEDNALNRELTNAVLRSAGYNVVSAIDGAEALMVVGRDKIDLMLLDIDLPFIDGHKVLEALREKGYDLPTIFISGLPGEEPEVRAFDIGAIDFIRKPVKNSVLLARVKRVLG